MSKPIQQTSLEISEKEVRLIEDRIKRLKTSDDKLDEARELAELRELEKKLAVHQNIIAQLAELENEA